MGREQTRPDAEISAKVRQNGGEKDSGHRVQRRGTRSIPLKAGLKLGREVLRKGGRDNAGSWVNEIPAGGSKIPRRQHLNLCTTRAERQHASFIRQILIPPFVI